MQKNFSIYKCLLFVLIAWYFCALQLPDDLNIFYMWKGKKQKVIWNMSGFTHIRALHENESSSGILNLLERCPIWIWGVKKKIVVKHNLLHKIKETAALQYLHCRPLQSLGEKWAFSFYDWSFTSVFLKMLICTVPAMYSWSITEESTEDSQKLSSSRVRTYRILKLFLETYH